MAVGDIVKNLRGVVGSIFGLGLGVTRVQLKNASGVFEARNDDDTDYVVGRGASPSGDDDWVTKGFADTAYAPPICVQFRGDGYFRPATGVDVQETQVGVEIVDVVLRRDIAGDSGTTLIDILLNGTSIWATTPANRPSIDYTDGDNARVVSGAPDTTTISAGDRLEMTIVSAEGGYPQDVSAFIRSV